MRPVARILIVTMLFVFAAGSTLHAAGTTVMDLKMAMAAAGGGMDMDECNGCDGSGGNPPCDTVCGAPLLAMASPDAPLEDAAPQIFDEVCAEGVLGQTGPPDPYPPRSLVLS